MAASPKKKNTLDPNPETIRELIDALRLAQLALNTAPRFRIGDTDSYRIVVAVDAAPAKVST